MLSSLRYVNIMKPAFEKAVALEPDNVAYLRAQVDVLVALPSLLGGSVEEALQLIQKIKKQDLYEGLLAEGSLYEKKIENRDRAKEIYDQLFLKLNQEYKSCSEAFIEVLKKRRRNFSYDLARISADFGLENEWGLCALSYFESSYLFRDTVPLAWVYYYQHIFAKKTGKEESAEIYFNKLENYKEVFPEGLKQVNNTKL
jgi:phage-related protein